MSLPHTLKALVCCPDAPDGHSQGKYHIRVYISLEKLIFIFVVLILHHGDYPFSFTFFNWTQVSSCTSLNSLHQLPHVELGEEWDKVALLKYSSVTFISLDLFTLTDSSPEHITRTVHSLPLGFGLTPVVINWPTPVTNSSLQLPEDRECWIHCYLARHRVPDTEHQTQVDFLHYICWMWSEWLLSNN